VYVEVLNENDNVPLSDDAVYYPTILEDSPSGSSVLQIRASDKDKDPNQKITYRITSGSPERFFSINSTTGLITTTSRKLDRETLDEHILEVLISDNGSPPLSSTTYVVVKIKDINDNAPEFEQISYNVQIPASADFNQAMFQVLAFDRDAGPNSEIHYSIKSGKGRSKFRIDNSTGMVYAQKGFEPGQEYELNVRVERVEREELLSGCS
jgi:protocadherin Fat 1/2/3